MSLSTLKINDIISLSPNDKKIINHKNLYEKLLSSKKHTAKKILIMGSQTSFEFNEYFKHAHIDYIDVLDKVPYHFINDKTKIYGTKGKTNIESLVDEIFVKNIKYDIIIDDGIHTENTIDFYMTFYTKWIADDGIIIIEDVMDWLENLNHSTPKQLRQYVEIYKITDLKNKLDDVIFVINQTNRPYNRL